MTSFTFIPLYSYPVKKARTIRSYLSAGIGIAERATGAWSETLGIASLLEITFLGFITGLFLVALSKEKDETSEVTYARYHALKGGLMVFGGFAIGLSVTALSANTSFTLPPLTLLAGFLIIHLLIFNALRVLSTKGTGDPTLEENVRANKPFYIGYSFFLVGVTALFLFL